MRRREFITALGGASAAWPWQYGIVLALSFFVSTPSYAEKRVALVIGNSTYQKVPALLNPQTDAGDIALSLERLGFAVKRVTNANFEYMRRSLVDFGRQTTDADLAVVFFAGHGMSVGGENWLIPVDAKLRSDTDVNDETISLQSVILQVSKARNLGLVVVDACRDNPYATKMKRSIPTRAVKQGLARTEPKDNVLIVYAAKEGMTADDGVGRNSPFTAALLNNLETPGLEVTEVLRNVRDEVMSATKRDQQPSMYGSLSKASIYFKEAPAIK